MSLNQWPLYHCTRLIGRILDISALIDQKQFDTLESDRSVSFVVPNFQDLTSEDVWNMSSLLVQRVTS